MQVKPGLKYTKDHEWLDIIGETAKIGITDFAQSELGEIVFVELPSVGKKLKAGDTLCVVESTKAASDVYAPVAGEVVEVNSSLSSAPDSINSDPYETAWLVKLKIENSTDVEKLLSDKDYSALIGQ